MDPTSELRPPPPMAKRVAVLTTLVVIAGLLIAVVIRVVAAAGDMAEMEVAREAAAEEGGLAPELDVVHPSAAEAAPIVVLSGTLQPIQSADLAFEVPGRVSRVHVALGATVRAGDTLVTLDRSSVGAQSAQNNAAIGVAEANAEMARERVSMLEPLVDRGTVPERELTTARQQLAVADAQVRQARAGRQMLAATSADHILRAPFDGVITRVPDGVGVVATPGVPLVRVEDLTAMRMSTTVNQRELSLLTTSMTARLEEVGAEGTLTAVVRSLDAATRRAPVEVRFPNDGDTLIANSFVRAQVEVGAARPALRVPATSVRPDGTVLLIGDGDRVVSRDVAAQADVDGSWLVTEGLTVEDRVVLRPATARLGSVVRPRAQEGESPTASLER
ncbi:MAG: efflux RND transporter periplasmic adaptor subunit [Sandaracinaceae bacterium]